MKTFPIKFFAFLVTPILILGCSINKPNDSKFEKYVVQFYKDLDSSCNSNYSGTVTQTTHVVLYQLKKTDSITYPYQYEVEIWTQLSDGYAKNAHETELFGFKNNEFYYLGGAITGK